MPNTKKIVGERVAYIEDPQKLVESVEAVVIATEWPQYQELDYRGKDSGGWKENRERTRGEKPMEIL
jgi:UDP-glucose 6-dehydrogenase